jgi:DNA-binding response OmpR family regulator
VSRPLGELGGIAQPSDLVRDVHLDGTVLLVTDGATAPTADAAVRRLVAAEHWNIAETGEAAAARWLASIRKTSLIVVTTSERAFALAAGRAVRQVSSAPSMVVGSLSGAERAEVLTAGADLVLACDIDDTELRAQAYALLRRSAATWEPAVRFLGAGEILLDVWARECTVGDRIVPLSPTEFRLLEFLMRHAHRALPAATIVQRVWGTGYAADLNALRIHISRLRRKLSADGAESPVIRSVRGVGYEFAANVLEMGDGSAPDIADQPHLALAQRLLDAGRSLPASVAEAAGYLTTDLVDSGACDAAAIFRLQGATLHLVAERGSSDRWRAAIAGGVPLKSNFAQAHAITTQRPTQVADIQLHAQAFSESARILADEGFHSCLFVPILGGPTTWGGLGLASRSRRPFDPVVTTYCMAVAAMFGVVTRTAGTDS